MVGSRGEMEREHGAERGRARGRRGIDRRYAARHFLIAAGEKKMGGGREMEKEQDFTSVSTRASH